MDLWSLELSDSKLLLLKPTRSSVVALGMWWQEIQDLRANLEYVKP